jgi:hypothetical protein
MELLDGMQGAGDVEQLGRRQPTAAPRALERTPDVTRPADRDVGMELEEARRLIGLVLEQGDVRRVGDRQGGFGELA